MRTLALTPTLALADALHGIPIRPAQGVARGLDRVTVNPILPVVFIIAVAVAVFVALAVLIGALAAYIYYCQSHGGRWPGLGVPGSSGGVYKLGCYK